ncbi:MAG TPA: sulfite exporter TauE/SafE family protein [Pyrinomonadaceae bacterium]|nr:sulfite exporter TauE/SafE family protein [Pyrinomonadaceae bacterium]
MNLFLILGLVLSGLIGLSLGLIGGGGSIITVPVLVYVLGVEAREAVGMSLAVVGATSLVGSFLHYRRGSVRLRAGLIFGAVGVVGALLGSPLTRLLSASALMMIFAGLMLVIAVLMMRRKSKADGFEVDSVEQVLSVRKALLAGFGVGVLTGFLGVGGGFLIVPALVMFGGLSMKDAIGTSLFVIFLNCVAGLIGHASQNNFDWSLTAQVTVLAVAGTVLGTLLSHRVTANKLQKGFAMFVLAVAVFLMIKNYGVFFGG